MAVTLQDRTARNMAAARARHEMIRNATPEMLSAKQAWSDAYVLRQAAEIAARKAIEIEKVTYVEYQRLWPQL